MDPFVEDMARALGGRDVVAWRPVVWRWLRGAWRRLVFAS